MAQTVAKAPDDKGKQDNALVTLNFKITSAFRKEFKGYAVNHGLTMVELLKEGFELSKTRRKPQ
jgi:hypothetical protein